MSLIGPDQPYFKDRTVEPPREVGHVTGFAWHPTDENTLLVAGNYGSFACWQVSDRLTVNWSGRHCLVWAGGKNRMKTVTLDADNDDDIAVIMQSRAKTGVYSFSKMEKGFL